MVLFLFSYFVKVYKTFVHVKLEDQTILSLLNVDFYIKREKDVKTIMKYLVIDFGHLWDGIFENIKQVFLQEESNPEGLFSKFHNSGSF